MQLTFDNIGKLFMSMESGPLLQSIDKFYQALLLGVRAYPINVPGFAYHRALQVHVLIYVWYHCEYVRITVTHRDFTEAIKCNF
jgi:hypothetical protein